jgi:hypothetical protein
MRHWTLLGEAPIPGSSQSLSLYQGKDDFFIRISSPASLSAASGWGSRWPPC